MSNSCALIKKWFGASLLFVLKLTYLESHYSGSRKSEYMAARIFFLRRLWISRFTKLSGWLEEAENS